jgi:ring-1,2-phenylacetyl-CoA epoxidase subunit PaaC
VTAATPQLPDLTTPRAQVLLAIADDGLLWGHRASHWTGVAPSLEEDLAFSTIAQDGINHADLWYQVLLGGDTAAAGTAAHVTRGALERRDAVDALALGRPPDGYRHAIVCERPPGDFATTLARHWILTRFEAARLGALVVSSDVEVAALARRIAHELRYHDAHADHWFQRLAHGGDDAHARFGTALADVLPESLGLFEPVAGEDEAIAAGLFPVGHAALREVVFEVAAPELRAAGYGALVPADDARAPADASGGRLGRHGPDLVEDAWPEMTALHRAHPGARW